MEEIWKPIEDYPGYEISNLGRIKSFRQNAKGKITYGNKDKKGYLTKALYDADGFPKTFKMHRLVAQAFIPNPDDLPQVNHKDEDKTNNCVTNLEWCDNEYNIKYGTRLQRVSEANRCCPTTSKGVYSVDENGNKEFFDSIGEAERQLGLSHCNIVRTLKGRTKTCGDRQWFYQE